MRVFSMVGLALLGSAVSAAACGVDLKNVQKNWALPDDSSAIESQSQPSRFPLSLEGTTAVVVTFKKPGFRAKAPNGKGWWEFKEVTRLSFKGKPFAVAGRLYQLSADKKGKPAGYLGCVTQLVIYDDDGDGKFETVVDSPGTGGPPYRLPSWATNKNRE